MTKSSAKGQAPSLSGLAQEVPAVEPPEAPVTAPPEAPARDIPDEAAPVDPPVNPPKAPPEMPAEPPGEGEPASPLRPDVEGGATGRGFRDGKGEDAEKSPPGSGSPGDLPGAAVLRGFFPGTARRRGPRKWQQRPSLRKRPDPLYPMKIKIAIDLGLLDKVRAIGWGGLTSAETGRVGGLMTRRLKGKKRALRLWPGRRRGSAPAAPRRTS